MGLIDPMSHFKSSAYGFCACMAPAVMEVTQICPNPNINLRMRTGYFGTFTTRLVSKCYTGKRRCLRSQMDNVLYFINSPTNDFVKKEKMRVTSFFFFSHNGFYPI